MKKSKRVLLALAALLAAISMPATAGLYFQADTVTDVTKGKSQGDFSVEAWVDGGSAKVVFSSADHPFIEKGSYLLTQNGGEVVYLVNPGEETYSRWDLDAMFQTLGQLMQSTGGLMSFDFSETSSEKVSEGPGEAILGHSTTHYRWKTGYTMEIKVMGMTQRQRVDTVTDSWLAADLKDAGFGVWLRKNPPTIGDPELDEMIRSQVAGIDGFPLKSVTVSQITNKKGKSTTQTATMTVNTLREEPIAANTFVLPPYREVDLMPQLSGAGEGQGEQQSPFSGLFGKGNGRGKDGR